MPRGTPGWYGGERLANWPRRTISSLIDVAVTFVLPQLLPGAGLELVVIVMLVGFNSVFLQARTCQSLGKAITGIALIHIVAPRREAVRRRPGYFLCAARTVLHLIDSLCLIGFLRPLWNPHRQTFADQIVTTLVFRRRQMI